MINKIKNSKLFLQIFKFGVVGGLAFIIDYSVLVFCKEVLNFNVLVSSALGFCISVVFNYIVSVKWVFDVNQENSSKKNFVLFIVFSLIGLLLTEIIMFFGTDILSINYMIVKVVSTLIVMVFNFITRKLFLEK